MRASPTGPYFARTWTYASSGNGAGHLIGESRGAYSRALAYNNLGEVTTDTETFNGTPWTMHYGWDTLGRLASITYPATAAAQTLKVAYAYDGNGNLASVSDTRTGTVYWQADPNAAVPAMSPWGVAQAWTLGNGVDVKRRLSAALPAKCRRSVGSGLRPAPSRFCLRAPRKDDFDACNAVP